MLEYCNKHVYQLWM